MSQDFSDIEFTDARSESNEDLKVHVPKEADYESLIASAKSKASRIRVLSGIAQTIIVGVIIILAMASAIYLSASLGLVNLAGADVSQLTQSRYAILSVLPLIFLAASMLVWIAFILAGGWFLYNPSDAAAGKLGATRKWYNSLTDALSENYPSVASGLTRALKISLTAKIRAINLYFFSLLSIIVLCMALISIFINYSGAEFRGVVAREVTDNLQSIQLMVLNFFSDNRATDLIVRGEVSLVEPSSIVCWAMFTLAPFLALFISYQLLRNAIDMRWSLLTSPDTVRRFMYMFVYRRNQDKNLMDEYAWDATHHYFLRNALTWAPEDFVGMDGRLFFYSDDVLDEVDKFARTPKPANKTDPNS